MTQCGTIMQAFRRDVRRVDCAVELVGNGLVGNGVECDQGYKPHKSATLLLLLAVIVTSLFTLSAQAANVPNFSNRVDFNVREQNVSEFLEALFQDIDLPISVNTALEGAVNGHFRDTVENVFKEISNAFRIEVYFDGVVVQVYKKNEIMRRMVPIAVTEANQAATIIDNMGLADSLNTVVWQDVGLLVTGFQKFQTQVDEVIASLQASSVVKEKPKRARAVRNSTPAPEESPLVHRVFKLKHAWATDTQTPVGGKTIVVPGVATILNELILKGGGVSAQQPKENSNNLIGLKGKGLNAQQNNTPIENKSPPTDKRQDSTPRIVADSRLNAIVIRDHENKMMAYQELIDSLDTESNMVEIEATIIDINTDKARDLGVAWSYQDENVDVSFGGPIASQSRGGILSFSLGQPAQFLATVRALEQQGAARIISKPHVITLSDVEAVLAATTEFFVRVAGDQEVDLFNVPVGTTLRVTPHVFEDGVSTRIKVLVNIEDGSQTASTPVDNIPVIERANISTQAVVNEGDSLLVGGLVRDSYRTARYQVPVLGSIPLVGNLFRSKTNQASRVERLFMITPRVARGGGFRGGAHQSLLAGGQNQIVRDASRRIESTDIPSRPGIRYWSERSRNKKVSSAGKNATHDLGQSLSQQASVIARTAQHQATNPSESPNYAIIEGDSFTTPFSVEVWGGSK